MFFVYTDDDKPEMKMPKQIDVKVTKPQNKHGHGRTWKCPITTKLAQSILGWKGFKFVQMKGSALF